VVIASIALLAAMLLPALAQARSKARYARWIGFSANNRTDPSCILQYDFENRQDDGVLENKAHGIDDEFYQQDDYHATIASGAAWSRTEGRWGGKDSLVMVGGNTVNVRTADISNTTIDDPSGEDITFGAWFKPYDLSSTGFVMASGGESSSRKGVAMYINSSETGGASLHNGQHYPNTGYSIPFEKDRWHHYMASYDNETGQMSVYVNGELVASPSGGSGTNSDDRHKFAVGSSPTASYGLLGVIDEVVIYNRPLNAQEVLDHYVMGQP
jgi:hypothetical protein